MSSRPLRLAIACVRAWTRLYTWRMPREPQETRRAEIESDLWESQRDAAGGDRLESAPHILLRLLIGIPDDLGWRVEQETVAGRLPQESIVLGARIAGAAMFACALFMIDADASRRRPALALDARSAVVRTQPIEETMTMRPAQVSRRGRQLSLLAAGIAATVGVAMLPPQLAAQTAPTGAGGPVFEAASVKPNRSADLGGRLVPQPGGRLTATNVPAAELIRFAYDLPDFQISGGPKWITSDRFDVVAKAEGDPPLTQKRLMLRRLLAERFKLTAHTETRDLPLYALVMARSDGRMGPRLRRAEADCARAAPPATDVVGIGPSPSNGPPGCGFFGFAPGTDFPSGRGGLAFRGLTMAALAKIFVPMLRRSVSDHTGLTGYFDAEFAFIAELPLPPPPPGVPAPAFEPFASVFTVLPEQLGLKLESRRGPVDVLIIDRMEQPTPD
jgi:uncharacterized protein (TIGR03435 family)